MKKKMTLLPPTMPNFIKVDIGLFERIEKQISQNNLPSISITELSLTEAEEYGELMKQTFIKHWRKKCGFPNITTK